MRWWRSIGRRWPWSSGQRREEDLECELRGHLELEAEERQDAGMAAEEARYAAQRAFDNVTLVKEDVRATWGWTALETLGQDLRFAVRQFRNSPGFSVVAVLSLALGIGANTAVFTFVNAALLKPLPYPQAGRIVALVERPPKGGGTTPVHSRSFVEWRERVQSFEALAIAQAVPVYTQGEDGPEQVSGMWATPELFCVFGVVPMLRRTFTDGEAGPGQGRVVLLSHGYWQRRFGSGDPLTCAGVAALLAGVALIAAYVPAR